MLHFKKVQRLYKSLLHQYYKRVSRKITYLRPQKSVGIWISLNLSAFLDVSQIFSVPKYRMPKLAVSRLEKPGGKVIPRLLY